MIRKSAELRQRGADIYEKHSGDTEKTLNYLKAHRVAESTPYMNELLDLGWNAVIRGLDHDTRTSSEAKETLGKGATEGSAVKRPKMTKKKRALTAAGEKDYGEQFVGVSLFLVSYKLGFAKVKLLDARVEDFDVAIDGYTGHIDGDTRQRNFLTDARAALVKAKVEHFAKDDLPMLANIAREYDLFKD